MKIFDNKIWRDGQKIAWIDGIYIHTDQDGQKRGYFENNFIYNMEGHKVAYLYENELRFENGSASVPLEHINEEVEGAVPLLEKCAVYVLLQD